MVDRGLSFHLFVDVMNRENGEKWGAYFCYGMGSNVQRCLNKNS